MYKKKVFIGFISLCLIATFSFSYNQVKADDFDGNESKYITLCSSSKLTEKQQKTCKEFNTYLNNKNKKLKEESQNTKNEVSDTKDSIEEITKQITAIDTKISSTNNELEYVQNNIKTLNKDVDTKSKTLEERLYVMQTPMNSSAYVSYILGAESFSDFFSRIINFKEITAYDNELIEELNTKIAEIQKQESTLKLLSDSLQQDKLAQADLQKKLTAKLVEQNKAIAANDSEISKNQESMESIQANLAALKKAANESKVSNVTQATSDKKKNETNKQDNNKQDTNKPDNNKQDTDKPDSNNNSNNQDSNQNNNSSQETTSNEELGLKIANKALTRQGYMYVWGGAHSWSSIKNPNWTQFDCSGLVNWAFYQCGVDLGRIHYTGSLVSAGKSVSKNDLQAGDIILFSSNGATSGVHHVGIYIGGNKMVHAPTEGEPVQVSNLSSSYWQREWFSCRRLY